MKKFLTILTTLMIILFSVIGFSQTILTPTILTPTTNGCDTTTIYVNTNPITFKGVIYDYPNTGQSTWLYEVTSANGVKNISHICFSVDLICINVDEMGKYSENNGVYTFTQDAGQPSLVYPYPKTGIIGVNFDEGFDHQTTANYYFILNSTPGIDVDLVGIKLGKYSYYGNLCGPEDCGQLPIELLLFNIKVEYEVMINWSTASETNNDYFTIEKSIDGSNFETIKTIQGAGNSNTIINYSEVDETPINGISYYRLKQTDYDGNFTYSKTISIENNLKNNLISIQDNNIYINVNESNYQIKIYDICGKLIYLKINNNFNTIISNNFNSGTYIIKIIKKNNQIITKKILIQ